MWSDKFLRKEETLRMSVDHTLGIKMTDEEFRMVKYSYLLGNIDSCLNEENRSVSLRYEVYEIIKEDRKNETSH